MTEKLKPCPAGHGDVRIYQTYDGWFKVTCGSADCDWEMCEYATEEVAARFWNDRPEDAEIERLRKEVEELKKQVEYLLSEE